MCLVPGSRRRIKQLINILIMILQGLQRRIDGSIRLLRSIQAAHPNEPIEIAYSGGKDSDVILQLAKEAGINYRAIYKNTTMRLQKLGELGWNKIRTSGRHEYGREPIPVSQMKPQMPSVVTPEITHLDVFRANGANNVFAGFMRDDVFFVVFIEGKFGELYNHS